MKTAVSIPDSIFHLGDLLAARLGLTRSDVYARGILQLARRIDPQLVTDSYDAAYADQQGEPPEEPTPAEKATIERKVRERAW